MSLVTRRAAVNRAVGAAFVLVITGLISNRLNPKSLLVARLIGALIKASVKRLAAVPKPDWASTEVLVSVDVSVPVKISETTSACGNDGSAATLVVGCVKGPSIIAETR